MMAPNEIYGVADAAREQSSVRRFWWIVSIAYLLVGGCIVMAAMS